MYSEPVQYSLFDKTPDTRDDEKNSRDDEQLTFEFMSRGTGDKETGDLPTMRV